MQESGLGKDKIFWDDNGEWIQENTAKITNDRITLYGWHYTSGKCANECKWKRVFSLIYQKGKNDTNWVSYRDIVTSKKCIVPGYLTSSPCERKKRDEVIHSSSCKVIER